MAELLRIFVSHSHKDEDFTQRLVNDLHQAGAEVWVDVSGIMHGNFMQRIDEALQQCQWMVLVLTPNATVSPYVKDEVYTALHRVKQGYMHDVVPVLAAPCPPGTIPPQWDTLHRYDATTDYALALAGVVRAVGLLPAATATTPTPADSVDGLLARGKDLMVAGKYAEALPLFERATQLAPNLFSAWARLGYTLSMLGRNGAAVPALERATMLDPTNDAAWSSKGMALHMLGRDAEALEAFERATVLAPKEAVHWNNQGNALADLKRYEEALAAYDRALVLTPPHDKAHVWIAKGNTLCNLKRYNEALSAFDHALELAPNDPVAWANKGFALRDVGHYSEGLAAFERSIALDGNEWTYWSGKADCLRALGRTGEAEAAEQRATELGRNG